MNTLSSYSTEHPITGNTNAQFVSLEILLGLHLFSQFEMTILVWKLGSGHFSKGMQTSFVKMYQLPGFDNTDSRTITTIKEIRCLKPNKSLMSEDFDNMMVAYQVMLMYWKPFESPM